MRETRKTLFSSPMKHPLMLGNRLSLQGVKETYYTHVGVYDLLKIFTVILKFSRIYIKMNCWSLQLLTFYYVIDIHTTII